MIVRKTIITIVVGGVIFHGNKVLILKRADGEKILPNHWELPSGKKLLQEDIETCLRREVREETRLKIKAILPFSVFEYQVSNENENEAEVRIQINYLAERTGKGTIVLSEEHSEFAWIHRAELRRYTMSKDVKKVIDRACQLKEALEILSKKSNT